MWLAEKLDWKGFNISLHLLWFILRNSDRTTWLTSQLPPLSCHCTDHSQLSQAIPFSKKDRLLSFCKEWDSTSVNEYVLYMHLRFIWKKLSCFYGLWDLSVFLFLVFHKFLTANRHITFKMQHNCSWFRYFWQLQWSKLITNIEITELNSICPY
jgi:hypothetical protein